MIATPRRNAVRMISKVAPYPVMPVEIERKFLVKNGTWRDQVAHSERLRDGLVARDGDLKVRVRSYANRTTLCVKSAREGIARDEFEYEIPADHAAAING